MIFQWLANDVSSFDERQEAAWVLEDLKDLVAHHLVERHVHDFLGTLVLVERLLFVQGKTSAILFEEKRIFLNVFKVI